MARYKYVDYGQMKLVPVSFARQMLPGSFECALNYLIDHTQYTRTWDVACDRDG
jgi:hypothetical protein